MNLNKMIVFKKLDFSRCPWCGERYDTRKGNMKPKLKDFNLDRFARYCHVCGKWGKENPINFRMFIIIGISLSMLYFLENQILWWILAIFLFCFVVGSSPVYRAKYDGTVLTPEEEVLCYVKIRWYTLKEGGVGLPRLRVINHMILPICFVDDKDKPITQVGCVRLCKRFGIFFLNAKFRAITDAINREKVQVGVKFFIFNQGDCIGEGIVLKKVEE